MNYEVCNICEKYKVPEGHKINDLGYQLYDRHKALLFEEQNQMTLDGARKRVAHGRLSMFKRMQFSKGMEVARFEDVLFFKKGGV